MNTWRSFRTGRFGKARIAITGLLVVAGMLWGVTAALAVHDNGMFELEGNVVHNAATTPPYDWTSLFGATGNQLITPDPINGPVLASAFVDDTDAIDTTYFAGGTKIDDQVHNMACGGPAANDKTSMDLRLRGARAGAQQRTGQRGPPGSLPRHREAGSRQRRRQRLRLLVVPGTRTSAAARSGDSTSRARTPTATSSSTARSPTAVAPPTSRSSAGTATTPPARSARRPSSPATSAAPSPATTTSAESRTAAPSPPARGAPPRRWPRTRSSKPAST